MNNLIAKLKQSEQKLKIQDLDQKAQFILNFWLDGTQNVDIEQFVLEVSETDEYFFYWLLDAETEEEREKVNSLTKQEKGVFVIYLQKASKLLTYK